jgi:hypothetical protein
MKKQLIALIAVMVLAASAFGQGQVTMANNSGSLVTVQATAQPVAIGSTSFQLYFTLPGAAASTLTAVGPVAATSPTFVGRIGSTIIDIPTNAIPAGTAAQFQILAWQSTFASYAASFAGGGLVGNSTIFSANTSPNIAPPPTPTPLAGLYPGFSMAPAPEPSTIALAGLGAATLLFFRRRKK